MKYVVTGVSRLTGEREVISNPHSEWKANLIMERTRGRSKKAAYTRLKVEPVERGGCVMVNVFCKPAVLYYLCRTSSAKPVGTSAIRASSIALGLHRHCGRSLRIERYDTSTEDL